MVRVKVRARAGVRVRVGVRSDLRIMASRRLCSRCCSGVYGWVGSVGG